LLNKHHKRVMIHMNINHIKKEPENKESDTIKLVSNNDNKTKEDIISEKERKLLEKRRTIKKTRRTIK